MLNWVQVVNFLKSNLSDLVQGVGILIALIISIAQLRDGNRVNRLNARISMAAAHRELWTFFLSNHSLHRIFQVNVNLDDVPITEEESQFVVMLMVHMETVYQAHKIGLFKVDKHNEGDFYEIFSLPIPKQIWEDIKKYQEPSFVRFLDGSIARYQRRMQRKQSFLVFRSRMSKRLQDMVFSFVFFLFNILLFIEYRIDKIKNVFAQIRKSK